MTHPKIQIALYGTTGHQITRQLANHPRAEIRGICGFEVPPESCAHVRVYPDLEAVLSDPEVQLVSVCAPRKDEQGPLVIKCLEAGKHVYAEKPCCMDEEVLDRIIAASRLMGMRFHEMGGTALMQPYATLRDIVRSGVLGRVIQVTGQKSYLWTEWRPKDERIDGGLALQAGVYLTRFVEHVAGEKIASIQLRETQLGNEIPNSDCRRAVSLLMTLENGGIASGVANYCCPARKFPEPWGYESLIIFGEKGFVEALDGGQSGRLLLEGREPQRLDFSGSDQDLFELFLDEIEQNKTLVPYSLEEEIRPTRWVIRAKRGY
ncbi:MAG: Gfo/Idh/MocA family oxidoreductase [Verrucomicrobia bacterium]|nr:Gfo/Idh/MocA family oxidoreductase [Verrucomicrobiota bacterium]MCH8510607.1 Gfo/Idh/MocA family oxidoreductase [Kiritimatiellia bacterium]